MKKRIKILFTIPNFDTAGSGKVVYDLVKGLDKNVFAPEICCFHTRGAYFKTIETLGVPIHVFDFATSYRPFVSFPIRLLRIVRFFKTHQFDLIHSWHWSSDFTEPLAAKLAGIPFIYTKKAMGWGNKAWVWRSKLSTKIITINKDMVIEFFSSMLDKVEQIPLGVDVAYFKPNLKFNISRESLNLKENDFVIISVANLVPVKGVELLLQVLATLNNPRIKVLIVGDDSNDYGSRIKAQYENENIQFLGKKHDVRPYLALSDLFVISTQHIGEGLPIALLEAMAMGQIVIGTDVPGINDLLSIFPAQLFEAENVAALKEKIEMIIKLDHKERTVNSKLACESIEKKYDISIVVEQHQNLYKRLAV